MEGSVMRYWLLGAGLILALGAPMAALADTPAATPQSADLWAARKELHPLFAPAPEDIEAAARLGERARKSGKTLEELLDTWSVPVPDADGKVIVMLPAARVAAAAYQAAKLHKDEAETRAAIDEALKSDADLVVFQVTLKSKGTGSWLWPYNAKPGDKKALESIAFALYDGRGHYYQPVDPNAERRIGASEKQIGSPVPVTVYTHVEGFWFNLPVLGSGSRTDFVAKYDVVFPLRDPKSGDPVVSARVRSLGLRIIGARGEKEARFSLAALQDLTRKAPR
jgi:hypothetical protein